MSIFWQDCVGENLLRKQVRKKKVNPDEADTQPIKPGLRPSGAPDCLPEVLGDLATCDTVVFPHQLQYKAQFRELVKKIREGQPPIDSWVPCM